MADGRAAEVGTIGNEDVVGLPLGDDRAPTSVYVQVPGSGLLHHHRGYDPFNPSA